MRRVLKKYTPDRALSFADVTVFVRTDITSSMIRFVETEHSETCFLFDCTYKIGLYTFNNLILGLQFLILGDSLEVCVLILVTFLVVFVNQK